MMGMGNRVCFAVCGMLLCVCGVEVLGQSVGDTSLSDAARFDSRAIVVLGYMEHHQGLIAGVRWPKVAFAIGDGTLLLTAAHCVDDYQEAASEAVSMDIVVISPYYGDVFDFDIVAIDREADVAILRAPWRSHPALALATEEELAAAKKILIAGRPQTVRRVSPDLRTELLSVSKIDESVPSEAVSLAATRLVAKGWSGSAMLVAETGRVAGVLTKLRQQTSRLAWFSYVSQSEVLGCSIRSVYSLLRKHGLEASALDRPVNLEPVADGERGFLLAITYFQALFENDRAKAVAAAKELTTLRPRSVQAHLLAAVGVSTVSMKNEISGTLSEEQFNFAEGSYAKVLSIDPNNAQAHALYGNLLIVRGRTPDALAHSDAALAVDPNNRLALFNRMRLIPPAQRKDIAERLVAVDPRNPLHWYYYSEALLMLGEKDDALRAAQKAADLDPKGLSCAGLANALVGLGRIDEAEPYFKRMTERCGCDVCWCRYAQFLIEYREGRSAESLEALKMAESKRRLGRVRQKDIDALRLQVLETSSPQEAEVLARQLLQADPNDAQCWWLFASILRTLEKYPEAVEAAQKAVTLDPNSSYQSRLANCLAKAGRLDDAQKTYDEMLRLHPDRGMYWYWYAEYLLDYFPQRQDETRLALEKAEAAGDKEWAASPDEIRQLRERLKGTSSSDAEE